MLYAGEAEFRTMRPPSERPEVTREEPVAEEREPIEDNQYSAAPSFSWFQLVKAILIEPYCILPALYSGYFTTPAEETVSSSEISEISATKASPIEQPQEDHGFQAPVGTKVTFLALVLGLETIRPYFIWELL